jgi:crotonobetainyl-CoA:carnitine CoA-transferase CaiB-like acyl-CoA transferase
MTGMLSGYRVLDFGRYISGPYCAALLADMGADVIRIEPVMGSDDRHVMSIGEGQFGGGALHYQVNRGKRSLAIDLETGAARDVIERLIARADVLIANMVPNALKKLRLDYASVAKLRPDIVLTSIDAYGATSPHANMIGFDGTGQALCGAMSLTGWPDQPFRSAVSYVDYSTAISAALGTVAALLNRQRTGGGQHVQCSLLGTALAMTNPMLIEEATGARTRVPTGNRSPIAGPSDLFRTRDGWVMIQVIGQLMFARWADLVERTELVGDPRFQTDQLRGDNGEELSRITGDWTRDKTTGEILALLRVHRIPGTPLLTIQDALSAPEIIDGGFLQDVAAREGATIPLVRPPFGFAGISEIALRSPALGEHSREILRELDIDDQVVACLVADGVVGSPTEKMGTYERR